MTDREFIVQLLADLRAIKAAGRPKTDDITKLLDKVKDHMIDTKPGA